MRSSISEAPGPIAGIHHPENSSPNLETLHSLRQITSYPRQSQVEESLMSAHKRLHLFEAKAADTKISRDEPAVARLNFSLANGEVLVVEVPRYVLERLLVRAKRAIEAAPLLARRRSTDHSAHSRNK
jgi:hypothetical protein